MDNPNIDPTAPRVAPLTKFRATDEFGKLVESTKPFSNHRQAEPAFYYCTERVASMHRPDGKKIPFVYHICETDVVADIAFLDREIDDYENPYLRRATPDEIKAHLHRKDPKGAMKKEVLADPAVRKEIEDSMRGSLEAQIRAQLRKEMGLPEEVVEKDDSQQELQLQGGPLDVAQASHDAGDAAKVSGTSALERLRTLRSATQVPGGTLIMGGETPAGVATHGGSQLKPVSSADIAGAAAGSGGQQE